MSSDDFFKAMIAKAHEMHAAKEAAAWAERGPGIRTFIANYQTELSAEPKLAQYCYVPPENWERMTPPEIQRIFDDKLLLQSWNYLEYRKRRFEIRFAAADSEFIATYWHMSFSCPMSRLSLQEADVVGWLHDAHEFQLIDKEDYFLHSVGVLHTGMRGDLTEHEHENEDKLVAGRRYEYEDELRGRHGELAARLADDHGRAMDIQRRLAIAGRSGNNDLMIADAIELLQRTVGANPYAPGAREIAERMERAIFKSVRNTDRK